MFDSGSCDWLVLPLLLPTQTTYSFHWIISDAVVKGNLKKREAALPSGLGRWIWNLEVPGSNPLPYCYLDLFSVFTSSTPRLCCINSQLVSLPPVGILNSSCSVWRSLRAYDSLCDSDFRFSLGHKLSYDSDYDPIASEIQFLRSIATTVIGAPPCCLYSFLSTIKDILQRELRI